MNSFIEVSMNDDAHKFTSDASETNSLENAKKLKENRLRCRNLKPLLSSIQLPKSNKEKEGRTKNFFIHWSRFFLDCILSNIN